VGVGGYPTIADFRFGQELVFRTDGRSVLAYSSTTWILDDAGTRVRPSARESGFWRPQPGGTVEVMLAHDSGVVEVYVGSTTGGKIELTTDVVARTASAKPYVAGSRLYGLVDGDLLYAYDMAAMDQPLQPHLSARLKRVPVDVDLR
jgi:hypothetical protein